MDMKPADVTLASGFVVSCLQKHEVALVDMEVQSYFSRGLLRLNPGDTVFDVGANIGLFMLAAWERCERNLNVYAFEPVGAIFERLLVNVERCGAGSQLQAFASAFPAAAARFLSPTIPRLRFSPPVIRTRPPISR